MDQHLDNLGDRLAAARKAHDLSYRDVADQTGIMISALHKIEHGGDPRLSTVRKVVAWLESLDAEERAVPRGSSLITPGGNPVCPKCGRWYGLGEKHECPPAFCDAEEPSSWARCYLEPGHGGPTHQAFTHYPGQVVSWPNDTEES